MALIFHTWLPWFHIIESIPIVADKLKIVPSKPYIIVFDKPRRPTIKSINNMIPRSKASSPRNTNITNAEVKINLPCWPLIRDRPRFFDKVGHQTTYAYIGNKHFLSFHYIMSSSDLPKLWTTSSKIAKFVHSKSFLNIKNQWNLSDFFLWRILD